MATITTKLSAGKLVPNSYTEPYGVKTYQWVFDSAQETLASGNVWTLLPAGTAVLACAITVETVDAGGGTVSLGDDSTSDPDDVLADKALSATATFVDATSITPFIVTTNPLACAINTANVTTGRFVVTVVCLA